MKGLNVPVKVAADMMGLSPLHLRIKIQNGRFAFASADKLKTGNKRYAYYINAKGLAEHIGKTVEEVLAWQEQHIQ